MASYCHVDSNTIGQELLKLVTVLIKNFDFPSYIFTSRAQENAKSKFAYPLVRSDDELFFENFYGNLSHGLLPHDMKFVSINSSQRLDASHLNTEEVKNSVIQCFNSVDEEDKDCATLSLHLNQIFFSIKNNMTLSAQRSFLRNGVDFDGQYQIRIADSHVHVNHLTCEWESPKLALQFLQQNGFERVSRERMDPNLLLSLRGLCLRKRVGKREYLYFDNKLRLNPKTLAVESWRIQNWYPLSYHLMHAFPSANDLVIKTNIARYVPVEDILKHSSTIPPMWTEPGLNGLLERTDTGFRLLHGDSSVKSITEIGRGERLHMKYKTVDFVLSLAPVKYYFYGPYTNEFRLTDDQACEVKMEFSMRHNQADLVEAVTHLTRTLFLFANKRDILPMTTSLQYVHEPDGIRVPTIHIQAVLRLQNEVGSLQRLLDLPQDASNEECRRKGEEVRAIMERSCFQTWVPRMRLDLNSLLLKLRNACDAIHISLR